MVNGDGAVKSRLWESSKHTSFVVCACQLQSDARTPWLPGCHPCPLAHDEAHVELVMDTWALRKVQLCAPHGSCDSKILGWESTEECPAGPTATRGVWGSVWVTPHILAHISHFQSCSSLSILGSCHLLLGQKSAAKVARSSFSTLLLASQYVTASSGTSSALKRHKARWQPPPPRVS